ncbi:MAG: hypothetical protein H6502_04140 [Candidatus Woesearchaeota archaeon]|nr:MAG: hypothetical protein H6502_04140 [Candidatus Woesearchaeota archaeon]
MPDLDAIKKKYGARLEKDLHGDEKPAHDVNTRDYKIFRKENMPLAYSYYESACSFAEKALKLKPSPKNEEVLKEQLAAAHILATPTGATSLSILIPLGVFLLFLFIGLLVPMALGNQGSLFVVLVGLILAAISYIPVHSMPRLLAENWRLRASNQMVLSIFYLVTFMRHTPDLEQAIEFASRHLTAPLSYELKKVIWDVETEKYGSLKDSIDNFLEFWKKHNMEYVESMNLIESSLFESNDARRINSLEKALDVMLSETYEKMITYAHELKSPLTTLHMLGIIMPILGLVILPLMVSFLPEVKWFHLFIIYNVALPIIVYLFTKNILATRPTGYGSVDISELNPALKDLENISIKLGPKEKLISPRGLSVSIFLLLFFIGLLPLIVFSFEPTLNSCQDIAYITGEGFMRLCDVSDMSAIKFYFLDYRTVTDEFALEEQLIGPYGLGALILSFFIPLSIGISVGFYYKVRSRKLMGIRSKTKQLEKEFASSLFQLGSRIGDGLPAEIAFLKVAQLMKGTDTGVFFEKVVINIKKLGMGVEQAIFDPKRGAINDYPSHLIDSSMRVLVQSSRKGPEVASMALMNISEYVKQMHRVEDRLQDLMADVVSSMQGQISFLTPAISGIVIGITSMITQIIGRLGVSLREITESTDSASTTSSILSFLGNGVPTYYFQIIVGLYVVQITILLSILVNGIQNGSDKLNERFLIGKNLQKSVMLYTIISLIITIIFSVVAGNIVVVN